MSTMRQIGLLAAGCQPWNLDVCAASGERFAYCSTLAIYVYQWDKKFNQFKLSVVMSEHKKTITAISWSPRNPDLFASCGTDHKVFVYNVAEQRVVASLANLKSVPTSIGWSLHERDAIAFISGRGPLYIWNYGPGGTVSTHKEIVTFFSDTCQFRWHLKRIGKIAFGHMDGSISVFTPGQKPQKHYLRPENVEGSEEEDPITALEWDPLSTEYLLVSNSHYGVRLIDTETMTVAMCFKLPSVTSSVHTLAWIPTAPGMFVTGDTRGGALRVWNVSKTTPVETIRLKKTGFHALYVIATQSDNSSNEPPLSPSGTSSTSLTVEAPMRPNSDSFAIPPAHIVCTFLDGGVGLYDLGKKKWDFLRDLGHVETIFDCKFKPENCDHLATASFDGTIKVWDVNSMLPIHSSPGNEGIIYALSWAPADLNCVAGATSRNGVFIWDIQKSQIIKRYNEHGKNSVYNVSWNHKDSKRIASVGADCTCVVRQVDGKVMHKYKHPAPVFGCDWSLNNWDMLATGCEDKLVRIFYTASTSELPLRIFTGHTAKVFHVKWHPLRDGVLCSGSDDGSIRIWEYPEDSCSMVLEGHNAPVRGLLWNPELPYLLLSGSWDYTIKVWDTRFGLCLDTVVDHSADVYGLTCHHHRPFTVASCSRDSTIRIWSLTPVVQLLQVKILCQKPWNEIVASNLEDALAPGDPLLAGRISKDLKICLEKGNGSDAFRLATLRQFSYFFSVPGGSANLWDLVTVINGTGEEIMPETYKSGILHMNHLVKYKASEAQELSTARMSRLGLGINAPSRNDLIRDAAEIHLKIGEIERYCELILELGEWDKALAVAPSVSMEYWRNLCTRRAALLASEDNDQAVPYLIACGNVEKLASFFMSRCQYHEAVLVAQVTCEGSYPSDGKKPVLNNTTTSLARNSLARNDTLPPVKNHVTEDSKRLLEKTSCRLADWYFYDSQPALAACCHLAVGNIKLAISKLIRANELELALSVGTVLNFKGSLMNLAIELLSRKCERFEKWSFAVELLKTLPNPEDALWKLCSRYSGTTQEMNELRQSAGLLSLEECLAKGDELSAEEKFLDAMKYYLLSPTPELAIDIGINLCTEIMQKEFWNVAQVWDIVSLMGCVRTDRFQQSRCGKQRQELLALSSYVGALMAMRRGYNSIVLSLFQHTRFLINRDKVEIPVPTELVQAESEAWIVCHAKTDLTSDQITPEQKKIWDTLVRKAGKDESELESGVFIVAGSSLPSHSDIHQSTLTGCRIRGAVYFLEDGRSVVSLNDALMWAQVNAFSPLGSGVRINPF